MARKILLYLIFTFITYCIDAQVTFQKSLNGLDRDESFSVHQTFDGGYIDAGNTSSGSNNSIYLIKTDAYGDSVWTKTYAGIACNAKGYDAIQTIDGGYVILGGLLPPSPTGEDFFLLKTDSLGNVIFEKTFAGSLDDRGASLKQTPDGGYIITGYTNSFGSTVDVFILKTDITGNTLWTKKFAGSITRWGDFINLTSDGGYIITGWIDSSGTGDGSVYLIKTDSLGNPLFSKAYAGGVDNQGHSVQQTIDGGYIIAGVTFVMIAPMTRINHIYLIKTDNIGNLLWTKKFGGCCNDGANSVAQTTDGGYILTGASNSFTGNGLYAGNLFIIKTNNLGKIGWCKYYGSNLNAQDSGNSIQQTTDGGYVATGGTSDSYYDGYLLKTDSLGNVGCNAYDYLQYDSVFNSVAVTPSLIVSSPSFIQSTTSFTTSHFIYNDKDLCSLKVLEFETNSKINIFPNPSKGAFEITGLESKDQLKIYDVTGRLIYRDKINSNTYTLDLSSKDKGIYLYNVIKKDGSTSSGKLIKE
jgi:hypothetical protein